MIEVYSNECLYKDTYTIIEMMNDSLRSKINPEFIDFLKQNKDDSFKGTVDRNVPLKNQNLRKEIKIMLSLIYINYFCEGEEKEKIIQKEEENIRNFYNKDIFETKNEIRNLSNDASNNKESIDEPKEMIVYKESVIQKIIKKLKKLFKI